uniref:Uncharacterized protein n=1 Tax=Oryza sativa subsp. japonica TaxID=39947 RepID=Q6Z0J4_ORYSJ|nr:hypothetical protein [Oryza sativa Japonica Group]
MRERRGGHRQTRGAPEAHARLPRHAPPAGGHGRGGRGQEGPIAIAAGHGRGHRGGGHGGPASPRHHLRGRGQAGPNSADHAASRGRGRRSGDATSASSRHGGGHADHAVRDVRRGGNVSTQQHHHRGRGQASPSSADHAASRGRGRCGGDANSSSPRVAGQASRFADHAASPGRGCGRWGWDSPLFVGGGARGVGVDLGLQARDGGTPNDGGHGAARGSERCGPPSASDQDSVPFVGTGARGVGVDLELQARGGRRPPRADRHREVWVPVLTTANANLDLFFHGGDEGEAVAAAAHAPRPPARGGGGDQDAAVAGAADAPRPPAIGGGAVGREPGRRRIRRERNARRAALNDGGAEAPARAAAGVPAEADADLSPTNKKLQSLYSSLLKEKELIQELLQGLRGVEECARAQAESPNRETIRSIVSTVLSHLASYDRVDAEATELRAQLQHPVPRPPELDGHPRDSLPPSVTRRLSRD